jgi:valyl-tRNA synthetase
VEATKLSLRSDDTAEKDRATTVLLDVLAESLRLLHPLLPFVTEEIYGKLPNVEGFLIVAPYPVYDEKKSGAEAEQDFAFLQELVRMVRTLRSECTIPPEKKLKVLVRTQKRCLAGNSELVKLLANIGELTIQDNAVTAHPGRSIGLAASDFEAFVFIADAVDMAFLRQKFAKELEKDKKFIAGLEAKLANEAFLKNAPQALVAGEKLKLEEVLKKTGKFAAYIRDMGEL